MEAINNGSLLNQMRMLAARAEGLSSNGSPRPIGDAAPAQGFGQVLANQLQEVSRLQQTSSNLATRFESGDPSVDIAEVMVAMQRSQIGFQAVTQVRNKLVAAYQEIMNMPV